MHEILGSGSTYKLSVKRYLKDLDEEIRALEWRVTGARDPSEIQSIIAYSETLKRKIRKIKMDLSKPIENYFNYLENRCDSQCVEIENIMRPFEKLNSFKSNELETI